MDCHDTAAPPTGLRCAGRYRRREPEKTLLYQIIDEHLEPFLEQTEQLDSGGGLPHFVKRELRAFLKCGILEHGFVRAHCHDCGQDVVVAFSCRGRGFCPSCGGRRMADVAAHLVDRVLPDVPIRQWVLSLPIRLRYLVAFDRKLCRRVRNVFVRAVLGWMERRAAARGVLDAETGAVTATQRFGSALNLNIHFHSLVLDGVFHSVGVQGQPEFLALPAPTEEDLARLVATIRSRILTVLRRSGLAPEEFQLGVDPLPVDSPTLAACAQASLQRRVALGAACGQPLPRRCDPDRARPYHFPKDRCVAAKGFSLHANVEIEAGSRADLERLARYLLRPPVSDDRLSVTGDGRIALELKTPYDDGTTHFLFEPLTFLERLAAIVPPPRAHLIVYHGVLAPAAALRPEIIPRDWTVTDDTERQQSAGTGEQDPPATHPRNYYWAELMRRVFAIDVLECPCGGRRSVISVITQPPIIRAILDCLGLSSTGSARSPPGIRTIPGSLDKPKDESNTPEPRFVPDPG